MGVGIGEFRGRGRWDKRKGRAVVEFEAGKGVTAQAAARIQSYMDQPRFTILNIFGGGAENRLPWPAFLKELHQRQYDLSTFRFSVFLTTAGVRIPRPRLIQQRPGVLHSRWARVEYDGPDTCTAWALPCRRADSSLWNSLLSSGTWQLLDLPTREELNRNGDFGMGLLDALKHEGFDVRTLKFSVCSILPLFSVD